MVKTLTIKQLKKIVAAEKKRAGTVEERRALESELKELRESKSTKLLKRLGRGFVVLTKEGAKATGRGIRRARKFAEETGAGEGLDIELESALPRGKRKVSAPKRRRVRIIRVKGRRAPAKVFVPGLGFVTPQTTARRVKRKPKRRKALRRAVRKEVRRVVRRRAPQDNGDFFSGGGLVDF